jgi:nicotinate-nucleotide pyrophosphorylase (carboxylating)
MSAPVDWSTVLSSPEVQTLIALAIAEDVGTGDATTEAIFPEPRPARARVVTRGAVVVSGLPLADIIFRYFDRSVRFVSCAADGQLLSAGSVLCELEGDLRSILTAERCALNFLMRLCGGAPATARAVAAVPAGTRARIYDTRKTTPGWRKLEKAAVRSGGGENHRMGLYDAVLIKDNHVAATGSVAGAVTKARAKHGEAMPVEVEIDRLDQLAEALAAGPDIVLLDNFSDADMAAAVGTTAGKVALEASGGITLERIPAVARTGVDRISLGAITHSAPPADLSLEVVP